MKSYTARQADIDRKAAQELKNNQDFVCTTNQWLQKLDMALQSLTREMSNHKGDSHSLLKGQDISIEKLASKYEDHKKQVALQLDEYRQQMNFSMSLIKLSVEESKKKFEILQDLVESISLTKDRINEMNKELSRLDLLIQTECLRLNNRIDDKAELVKKEIEAIPSEIPSLKTAIAEKSHLLYANFNGLVLEIERIKKNAFVSSKYIEDLYTKLKNLKEVSK